MSKMTKRVRKKYGFTKQKFTNQQWKLGDGREKEDQDLAIKNRLTRDRREKTNLICRHIIVVTAAAQTPAVMS